MKSIIITLTFLTSVLACASEKLPTAKHVDVNQYVGKWYAVYSLPQFFTRKCVAQTADYAIKTADSISVLNTCIKKDGSTKTIKGQAEVVNKETNAELVVTFNNFWTKLFRVKGDYTIVKLDDSYSTVLVGTKDRKSLWIMSRTPYIQEETKNEYIAYAKSLGFDTDKLIESHF